MPYYPIDAFILPGVSRIDFAVELVQSMRDRLPDVMVTQGPTGGLYEELAQRLPGVDITLETFPDWKYRELRLNSDNDQVVVTLSERDLLILEFWDFDPDVYDAGGPTLAMIQDKRGTALQLMCALVERCGARLAYFSSADDKYGGDWDAIVDGIRAALEAPEKAAREFQRAPHFWMVALRREDEALHQAVVRARPGWQVARTTDHGVVLEDPEDVPYFMIPPGDAGSR